MRGQDCNFNGCVSSSPERLGVLIGMSKIRLGEVVFVYI